MEPGILGSFRRRSGADPAAVTKNIIDIFLMKKQYDSPSLRAMGLAAERSFLASGEGENADPTPGTWSFFDELEME